MANGAFHRNFAAAVTGITLWGKEAQDGKQTWRPVWGAMLAAEFTNLPDLLEPAVHPHHRQFFHSIAFAGLAGWGMHKVYEWQPENEMEEFMKFCILVGGASVLIHLAVDSLTPRSLPLVGRLN